MSNKKMYLGAAAVLLVIGVIVNIFMPLKKAAKVKHTAEPKGTHSSKGSDSSSEQYDDQFVSPTETTTESTEPEEEVPHVPTDEEKADFQCVTDSIDENAPGVGYIHYSNDYHIVVYVRSQKVVVYCKNTTGKYNLVYKCFSCSTGLPDCETRPGNYRLRAKYEWRWLEGANYGHYNSSISSNYLFHSVPYEQQYNAGSLLKNEYKKLGHKASHGCMRLCIRDAKWIYDNVPIDTIVSIVNTKMDKVEAEPIPPEIDDPKYLGWDPSDKWSEGNPYYVNGEFVTTATTTESTTTTTTEATTTTTTTAPTTSTKTAENSSNSDIAA